ncbi:hypothetical protein CYY_006691, partial [Polysphondylium violaceum]
MRSITTTIVPKLILVLLFVGVLECQLQVDLLYAELGQELDDCNIQIHFVISSLEAIIVQGSPNTILLSSVNRVYSPNLVSLFSVQKSFGIGPNDVFVDLRFQNGSINPFPLHLTYTCVATQYSLSTYLPGHLLSPNGISYFYFTVPNLTKQVRATVTWESSLGSEYTSSVQQHTYEPTLFQVTIKTDIGADIKPTANFTIILGSGGTFPDQMVRSTMRNFDPTITSFISSSRSSYYSDNRPFLPSLQKMEGDPRELWFYPSVNIPGYLVTDYVKGSPKASTTAIYTLVYSIPPPIFTLAYTLMSYNGVGASLSIASGNLERLYISSIASVTMEFKRVYLNDPNSPRYLNVKFDMTSDPETALLLSRKIVANGLSKEYIIDAEFSFPLGFGSKTLKDTGFDVSLVVPSFMILNPFTLLVSHKNEQSASTPLVPTLSDNTPPNIEAMDLKCEYGRYCILTATINDNISGFNFLTINGRKVLQFHDLIQGTLYNGFYAAKVDMNYLLVIDEIIVFDKVLEATKFNYGFYNALAWKLNPVGAILSPSKISLLEFAKYGLDLSDDGQWNTLYFNYTGAGPYSRIIFYPIILVPEISIDDPDIKVNPKYQYEWDLNLKMFKIDFYLPRGLYTKNITYYLGDLSNTGLHSSGLYSSEQLYKILGETALLSVYSSEANQMFPYFNTFSVKGSQTYNLLTKTDTATIGWVFSVETLLHPIKYITFTVTSNYDPQGKNYTFLPNDSLNNDPFNGTYELVFPVSGALVSQEYKISFALLQDESGRQSGYNYYYMADAFYMFTNTSQLSITITTPPVVDVTPPYLDSWVVSAGPFLPMSSNRTFEVLFTTKDLDSPLSETHVPVVYLIPSILDSRYACNTTIVSIWDNKKTVNYKAECNPDYGFGYPYGFSLSVYGIVDANMNVRGYSGAQLQALNLTHYLDASGTAFVPELDNVTFEGQRMVLKGTFGVSMVNIEVSPKDQINWGALKNSLLNYNTKFELSINYTTDSSFYVRVVNSAKIYSNTLLYLFHEEGSSSQGPPTTPKPTTKPLCPNNCGG